MFYLIPLSFGIFCFYTLGAIIGCVFFPNAPEVKQSTETRRLYNTPTSQEIDRQLIKLAQREEIKNLSRDFKPTILSDYEKRYMPR